jgi:serine phosphatase RsbU (regulator of sigma subunit)
MLKKTDGIVEYQDRNGAFYGENRFYKELKRLKDEPVSVIVDGIIDSIVDLSKNNKPRMISACWA